MTKKSHNQDRTLILRTKTIVNTRLNIVLIMNLIIAAAKMVIVYLTYLIRFSMDCSFTFISEKSRHVYSDYSDIYFSFTFPNNFIKGGNTDNSLSPLSGHNFVMWYPNIERLIIHLNMENK